MVLNKTATACEVGCAYGSVTGPVAASHLVRSATWGMHAAASPKLSNKASLKGWRSKWLEASGRVMHGVHMQVCDVITLKSRPTTQTAHFTAHTAPQRTFPRNGACVCVKMSADAGSRVVPLTLYEYEYSRYVVRSVPRTT